MKYVQLTCFLVLVLPVRNLIYLAISSLRPVVKKNKNKQNSCCTFLDKANEAKKLNRKLQTHIQVRPLTKKITEYQIMQHRHMEHISFNKYDNLLHGKDILCILIGSEQSGWTVIIIQEHMTGCVSKEFPLA